MNIVAKILKRRYKDKTYRYYSRAFTIVTFRYYPHTNTLTVMCKIIENKNTNYPTHEKFENKLEMYFNIDKYGIQYYDMDERDWI